MTAEPAFLALDQPLDLATTLSSGQSFSWRRESDGAWVGVLGRDIIRLRAADGGLLVRSAPTPAAELSGALTAYLRLDDDLPAIQRRLAADSRVRDAIAAYPGLRLLRQDPWETLAAFILSQNSNIPRIARTIEAIAQRFGEPVELDDASGHAFPSPQRLMEAGEEALRELGCGYRAPYLAAAAAVVASGEMPLDSLRGAGYDEAQAMLLSILGVGEKVADCVMLFALDQLNAFPVDRWVRRAIEEWYAPDGPMTYPRARAWALERFGPDAGYANQYLFWRRRQAQGTALDLRRRRTGSRSPSTA